ncbi:MAG: futalosine hydrolase [Nitrospirae bacterium]|nr:futalosine hydrolase [Nitrospirota bacterium]
MVIALFHAVAMEAGLVIKHLSRPVRFKERTARVVVRGELGNADVICMETGVGKVNAAMTASLALFKYHPDLVISMGIGGAYPDAGLNVGDIAVAECEVYGDEGVILEGDFLTLEAVGIPFYKKGKTKLFNTFPLHAKLTLQLYDTVSQQYKNTKAGAFVTVSSCTGTRNRADELTKRYSGICENMEGAAIVHTCKVFGTPVVELRGISNIAADRGRGSWECLRASKIAQHAVIMFIKTLGGVRCQYSANR